MAKRKAASAAGRRRGAAGRAGGSRARSASRKRAKGGIRKTKNPAARAGRATAAGRKSSGARGAAGARKAAARKAVTRKAAPRKPAASRSARSSGGEPVRKAPALNRTRRLTRGEDIVPTPPSPLDLDLRHPSAARSGRKELKERQSAITQTGPALTAGDVDADWESAYSVGDEAPGGDNPTPDQEVVDDIG